MSLVNSCDQLTSRIRILIVTISTSGMSLLPSEDNRPLIIKVSYSSLGVGSI